MHADLQRSRMPNVMKKNCLQACLQTDTFYCIITIVILYFITPFIHWYNLQPVVNVGKVSKVLITKCWWCKLSLFSIYKSHCYCGLLATYFFFILWYVSMSWSVSMAGIVSIPRIVSTAGIVMICFQPGSRGRWGQVCCNKLFLVDSSQVWPQRARGNDHIIECLECAK